MSTMTAETLTECVFDVVEDQLTGADFNTKRRMFNDINDIHTNFESDVEAKYKIDSEDKLVIGTEKVNELRNSIAEKVKGAIQSRIDNDDPDADDYTLDALMEEITDIIFYESGDAISELDNDV